MSEKNGHPGNSNQYKYEEMSNKVSRADRRLFDEPRSRGDVSSNPESLAGRISVKDMGTRAKVAPERPSRGNDDEELERKKPLPLKSKPLRLRNVSDLEALNYVPTTLENQQYYDLILSWCSGQMDNDVSHEIVRSLTDMILEVLKTEDITDVTRQKKVEELLEHKLSSEQFEELLSLSKRITDYKIQEDIDSLAEDPRGVAVVLEDDEEDEIELADDDDEATEGLEQAQDEATVEGFENLQSTEEVLKISGPDKSAGPDLSSDKSKSVSIKSVDQFYLRRIVANALESNDSVKNSKVADQILQLILQTVKKEIDVRFLENELVELFDFEHTETVGLILKDHVKIYYGILLSGMDSDSEKLEVFNEMKRNGYEFLVEEYLGGDVTRGLKRSHESDQEDSSDAKKVKTEQIATRTPRIVDLDSLVFDQGSHLRTSTTLKLPPGAFKLPKKYEEIHIPAPEPPKFEEGERLVPINELPEWVQPVFPASETATLNRIQSKVYPTAFNTDKNILMCAPTGAGKTNVAMLTILRTLDKFRKSQDSSEIDLEAFKIVYIAPLKALVQEQMREFQRRLSSFGITVSELTGDSNLTKQQIASTQILVTTPEKWDVITRKSSDISYVNLVRLVIIDEIHLLHDERGPVLESIVSRVNRDIDQDDIDPVRLVGLSATLPNYQDVAKFLRVEDGLFYFDSTYRPCPLAQQFVGINEKRALKRYQAMNEVCYEKILENVSNGHQIIVFVHSRKETFKTAKWIRDKMLENDDLGRLVKSDSASIEILKEESDKCKDSGLKDLLPTGFAIHHAGLSREDRSRSEDLFAEGYVQVLISTATLAWGVNLPAHTVIIKGTNVYSPEKGAWVELSPQDILQMLGRAGRPRYDKSGEGIIITSQDEIQYYLAILNQQLPIESQFMSKLCDNLNAEVVTGSVKSLDEAVNWLLYTYFYVRMSRSPEIYRVGLDYADDEGLKWKRTDLAHSALSVLSKNMLANYDLHTGLVSPTLLGTIASHYYISYESMDLYNRQLKHYSSPLEILRIFAQSGEFKYIPVREEEKGEISKLLENTPIPVRESEEDPLAKINVLLQSYISRLHLDGFALLSDMIYITQSAGRLLRALHEIALGKGWSLTARITLDFCKMVEKRMWLPNSPFRQFPDVPYEVVKRTESSQMPWKHYFQLSDAAEMAQAIRSEKYAKTAFELLQKFPKVSVTAECQPITPSLLRVGVEVLPEWVWDDAVHGFAQTFIVLVEDCNGEKILYHDTLLVKKNYINTPHFMDFTVPLLDPPQPNYFISLISDKWLHCESKIPLLLTKIKPLKKFPAPTPLLNSQPIPVTALKQKEFESCFEFTHFNKFQTQVFQSLYHSNENILIGMSKGCGKTVCAELALLHHWKQGKGRAVYISPYQQKIDSVLKKWKKSFSKLGGGKVISKLTGGDLNTDLQLLLNSHLVLATPGQFDSISRRWRSRKSVQSIELFIADDCHTIDNGLSGCMYEVIMSRMKFLSLQLNNGLRVVALSTLLANGRDFGDWIGASKNNIFNFSAKEKISPVEIHIQSFAINHNPSMIMAMTKPAFNAVKKLSLEEDKTGIVFVPTRKHCVELAYDFIRHATNEEIDFLKADLSSMESYLKKVKDLSLREALTNGIGFYYDQMNPNDRNIVERLYSAGALTVLLATRETCYFCPQGSTIVILSTQFYEGKEHRYVDYSINELLEMAGVASDVDTDGTAKVLILTNASKREYYKKFISESLPLESHFNIFLHDILVSEITNKVVVSRQSCIDWLTYSYFYRRLQLNPSFYGLKDTSHFGLSEHLSDLVESTLTDLSEAKLIELEDEAEEEEEEEESEEFTPLNGALIAAYYNISFVTMQTFIASLTSKTKLKGLLEILSAASEFDEIPIRAHEQSILAKIYNRVPIKSSNPDYESPLFKVFILLQAHFSRMSLPPDLVADQKMVLEKIVHLLYTAIDILSTEGFLNAVSAMDLSQMIVQAVWDNDNPLKQVPYFDEEVLKRCDKLQVKTVYDIMSLEDEERDQLLSMSPAKLNKVAEFVNNYPNIDISYKLDLSEPMVANEDKRISIEITRDEEPETLEVVAPYYPVKKTENWWIAIGESSSKQLYAIKKTSISKEKQTVNIDFSIPDSGKHQLSIWCICDSYVDADKEIQLQVSVEEGEEGEEEEEEEKK